MKATKRWSLDDIPWDRFDPYLVDADILKVVKTAALVEYNAEDYAAYLCGIFNDDPEFSAASAIWASEEVQHGAALGRWARLADPEFDFDAAVARFRAAYRIDVGAQASSRGSPAGELIARCMVETGTSSYYSALAEAADEPVLKAICQRISADELRHYKLFYSHLKRYQAREELGLFRRLRIAFGRIVETEDDELACAYFAANGNPGEVYARERHGSQYLSRAYSYYRRDHLDRVVGMFFKACGLRPQTLLFRMTQSVAWTLFAYKATRLRKAAA